ncbi:MAG: Rrf2 family transcriptional regulator [Candidatus Abyssobacteria bacterium SURF_5]|uniref:Rrf2 family transcriptional regulator n=1 Tax=Abyssobacteria bacterium (strain SURF_5) TaxID=2093360 RepID=A0A3A4NLS9_ABYX5|nr:MAG: Rrf2 family transcriptional regulator [Candidatus Abyssubacteria bacterium SURF_5]
MSISQKCQYALRAVFELAKQQGEGPVKISDIARTQAIPTRFLEVILNQLKQGGFVDSRRGSAGGYILTRSASALTVGEIIRFIEGPLSPVQCITGSSSDQCPLHGECAFLPMWEKAKEALAEVYDTTSFQDLVEQEELRQKKRVLDYSI